MPPRVEHDLLEATAAQLLLLASRGESASIRLNLLGQAVAKSLQLAEVLEPLAPTADGAPVEARPRERGAEERRELPFEPFDLVEERAPRGAR